MPIEKGITVSSADAELMRKADLALSDITSDGGLLNPVQNNSFIDLIEDEPTLVNEVLLHRMNAPKEEINKITVGEMIVRPAKQTPGGANSSRALVEGDRWKPTTSQIELNTVEIMSEARIRYEVLEDNIEKDRFEGTLLRHMAKQWARDLEKIIIQSDTGVTHSSPETVLDLFDGVLASVSSKVVDAGSIEADKLLFKVALDTLGRKYAQDLSSLRFYTPFDIMNDLRLKRSDRATGLGDVNIANAADQIIFGVKAKDLAYMPANTLLLCNPQNIILGFQRNMRVERDVDITTREHIFVATARIALQLFDESAFVKINNVATMAL